MRDTPGQEWVRILAGRCQRIACADTGGGTLSDQIRSLPADLPADLGMAERLAVRNILTLTLARIARLTRVSHRPDVSAAFLAWAACDITGPTWREDVTAFAERCANLLPVPPSATLRSLGDVRIARAVQAIESRYSDPNLSLAVVAFGSGVSAWHIARLLKRATGLGFTALLRHTRVAAAQRLLEHDDSSIKQIAAAVGYRTSSQFCRHFKRLVSTTPTQYRSIRLERLAG